MHVTCSSQKRGTIPVHISISHRRKHDRFALKQEDHSLLYSNMVLCELSMCTITHATKQNIMASSFRLQTTGTNIKIHRQNKTKNTNDKEHEPKSNKDDKIR